MRVNSFWSAICLMTTINCLTWLNTNALEIDQVCPRMFHKVFEGFAPIGNKTAGNYKEFEGAANLQDCVIECCAQKDNCNVAFVFNQTCYHVKCVSDEQCLPLERPNVRKQLKMVLVNPATDEISWRDVLKVNNLDVLYDVPDDPTETGLSDSVYRNRLAFGKYLDGPLGYGRLDLADQYEPYENDLAMEESKISLSREGMRCDLQLGDKECPENEGCFRKRYAVDDRFGVCKCKAGFERSKRMKCVPQTIGDDRLVEEILKPDMPGKLAVSVVSKTVQLPERKVALAAYPVPDENTSGDIYNYTWSLISQPTGDVNGTISDKTKKKIELQNLSEGLYRFKVVVSGKGWLGETFANVTVLPEQRINTAPIVRITPMQQIIKEPTTLAILDGSTSTDDDHIKSWHWDLIQGPINYQPTLPETSTLQLTNLTLPGNYTFKLTVTDSDNIANSTTASITVLKATDYPPTANAGQPQIVELPENSVTLDGSQSSDDHEITAWEWTKDASDSAKAVDMQDTRTPFLHLSNLEEGIYTFVLKVTDASNQSNTASVRVFVKPPSNKPPQANAGLDVIINLPQTWTMLNATNSTDEVKISTYQWTQIDGPNTANILDKNAIVTNATGLAVGTYTFELIVIDENHKNGTSRVRVTVVQEKNTAPVAHAGGDQTITMPANTIYMNGSTSNDDLGIVKYEWTRDSTSLAIGTIVGNTDHEPVLILTNIVPGRYVFVLTVTDAQGLSGNDTVSVIVHPDPLIMSLVEITFGIGVTALTQAEVLSLEQKLLLLLGNNMRLNARDLRIEQKTGEAILVFYVEREAGVGGVSDILMGIDVERMLADKLWQGSNIVGTPISDIRTTVCQNRCSGHGVCNSETRTCMCETFWMPSVYYFWGFSEANCDWSILYVVIGTFILFILISTICWALTCYCRRTTKPRARAKTTKYALLESQDNEAPVLNRSASLSESETDSDVLFESQSKSNGLQRLKNGSAQNGHQKQYATTRLGRRIKA